MKSYDHFNFPRASVVQFRACRYIMCPNRIFEWKLVTIWILIELLLFNFKCLDILCAWIGHPSEKLWPFEFLESFCCSISSVQICYAPESDIRAESYYHLNFLRAFIVQFRASRYIIHMNRTSEWKVMTVGISIELSMFNFKGLNTLCPRIGHPCENLWQFEFLGSFRSLISSITQYYSF